MFTKPKRNTYVDGEITRVVLELQNHEVNSEKYVATLDLLAKLQKIREDEKMKLVSPDTAVMASVNLLGIFMIIKHEHVNVITSKAMAFVAKGR